jgi:hypothetical protein
MNASNMLLNAFISDEISLGGDEQRLIGLIKRMTLFAPPDLVRLRANVEIALKPNRRGTRRFPCSWSSVSRDEFLDGQ